MIVLNLVALLVRHGFTHSIAPFHWTTARPSHYVSFFSKSLRSRRGLIKAIVELSLRLITAMVVKSTAWNPFIFGLLRLLGQLGEDLDGTLRHVRISIWLLLTVNLEFAKSRV